MQHDATPFSSKIDEQQRTAKTDKRRTGVRQNGVRGSTFRECATAPRSSERQTGVRALFRAGRPKAFGVEWRVDGKRKSEWFPTADARDRKMHAIERERAKGWRVPSAAEIRGWNAFLEATAGTPWTDVVAGWKEHLRSTDRGIPVKKTVDAVCDEWQADYDARLARGAIAKVTVRRLTSQLKRIKADFAGIDIGDVTTEQLSEWLAVTFESPVTSNDYRKTLGRLFGRVDNLLRNPIDKVEILPEKGDEVGILGGADCARVFEYAQKKYPQIVPRLACEAFAGLRFGSACRLERADIDFKNRGILLPAQKIKTGSRHYVDRLPENLWDWLELESPGTWATTQRDYQRFKSRVFDDLKVVHLHNCLRHSFCTHHVAAFADPGRTATILCHRDQQLLWSTYKGVRTPAGEFVTKALGEAWFAIRPK